MDPNTFPNRPLRPGSLTPLATIANVACLLAQAGIRCRYNTIKKSVEIDIPDHEGTSDNRDNVTMTAVISLAAEHGMPTGHVGEYVNAIADRNAYNPVADWIRSRSWDGIDRLPEIYATVIADAEYPEELKQTLLRKWLRSATAAALKPAYKGRGVLTLQGPQGIGKTSWVKALVSEAELRDDVVKIDHHLDASNKDTILGAIGNWIVEIGELDSSFKKDVARLKGFLTSDSDRVRRPYDRRESVYERRTVFVATVNEANFLVDSTGNSRWWTIAVRGLNFSHGIDTQQLFAQVAAEVEAGEAWWLTPAEEAQLEKWNARHVTVSAIAERVHAALDLDSGKTVTMTASKLLQAIGIDNPSNPQAKECGAVLRDLLGPPKRIQGIMCWRVPLMEPTGEEYNELRKNKPSTKKPSTKKPSSGPKCAPGEVF